MYIDWIKFKGLRYRQNDEVEIAVYQKGHDHLQEGAKRMVQGKVERCASSPGSQIKTVGGSEATVPAGRIDRNAVATLHAYLATYEAGPSVTWSIQCTFTWNQVVYVNTQSYDTRDD